jgi:hypothetical protein
MNCLALYQLKILQTVIATVVVLMMNNFLRGQWPSEMLGHNVPMFKNLLSGDIYPSISSWIDNAAFKTVVIWPAVVLALAAWGAARFLLPLEWHTTDSAKSSIWLSQVHNAHNTGVTGKYKAFDFGAAP